MTKRKGKPKAKTKSSPARSDGDCPSLLSSTEKSTMTRPIETEVVWQDNGTFSIVKESSRLKYCPSSQLDEANRRQQQRPTVSIRIETESGRNSVATSLSLDCMSSSTCKNQQQRLAYDSESTSSLRELDSGKEQAREHSSKSSLGETAEEGRIDNVRANFIGLNRYNQLQYFYFGALIYSVINLLSLLQFLIYTNTIDKYQGGSILLESPSLVMDNTRVIETTMRKEPITRRHITGRLQAPVQSAYESESRLENSEDQLIHFSYAKPALTITRVGHDPSQLKESSNSTQREQFKVMSRDRSIAFILVLIILPLSLLLLMVIILTMIEFNSTRWHSLRRQLDKHSNCRKPKYIRLEPIGSTLAMFLLMWPIYFQQMSHLGLADWIASDSEKTAQLVPSSMPVGALAVNLYSLLALLQSSLLLTKILCALLLAPASLLQVYLLCTNCLSRLILSQDLTTEQDQDLMLALLIIATTSGLLKRRLLVNTMLKTFAGTSELIEAKVSLEQQRQQQETLLLSVLPAYVAEQVKRNMVKKITNNIEMNDISIQGDQQHSAISSGVVTIASSLAYNSTNIANQRPSNANQSDSMLASENLTSSEQQQLGGKCELITTSIKRNSFLKSCSKSGATYLSEALKLNCGSSQQSNQQFSAFHPTSIFSQPPGQARRGFNELFIRTYNNVSLLYGDIVGFTCLCTQLSSSQLVRVLNDLFSHFDHLAEQHKIMRIKILGDCYYGVSGIPEFAVMGTKRSVAHHQKSSSTITGGDNHAINCVNMGLDMISHIKSLRVEHQMSTPINAKPNLIASDRANQEASSGPKAPSFELNMRIGIHTGHIHSGVIGLKKWQFDVWSNDVSIAMHCESSGFAGRVQVTEATVQHLHGEFTYELAPKSQRDSYLADNDIRTYLVCERVQTATKEANSRNIQATCSSLINKHKKLDLEQQMDDDKIRAATIGTIKQVLLSGETANSNPKNAYALALGHNDLKPLSLRFIDRYQEKMFDSRGTSRVGFIFAWCITLALVLLVFRFSIDHKQRARPETRIMFILCLIGLILVAVISFRGQCRRLSCNTELSATQNAHKKRPISRHSNIIDRPPNFHEKQRESLVNELSEINAGRKRSAINLGPLMGNNFVQKSSRLWLQLRHSKFELTDRHLVSGLMLLIFGILISSQALSSVKSLCGSALKQENFSRELDVHHVLFRQKMTLILTIIAIELLNCDLIGHKSKCLLISANCLICFVLLITSLPEIYTTVSKSNQNTCRTFLDLFSRSLADDSPLQENEAASSKLLLLLVWSDSSMILILAIWSFAYIRQIEYALRCNFLWRNRLSVDHEELEYISGINKVLLENILPSHVVQHYLDHPKVGTTEQEQPGHLQKGCASRQRRRIVRMSISHVKGLNSGQFASEEGQLYHEQHDSVAVMFASIPHFYEFYDESDINKQGLGCIALLNEIICDFDKLLLKNKFSRIEKIKTIGSTYMAAAGLRPLGATSSPSGTGSWSNCIIEGSPTAQSNKFSHEPATSTPLPTSCNNPTNLSEADQLLMSTDMEQRRSTMSQQKMNLTCMIQFASSLMNTLNGINKQSFQVFKLRVGVNSGPVIAGIIGAQRPFYDIWGDCVNIASRMESLGEIGRIQVEEKTAKMLMECLCTETYSIERRGPIAVKGKGGMVTYFVDRKQQNQQVHVRARRAQTFNSDHDGRTVDICSRKADLMTDG